MQEPPETLDNTLGAAFLGLVGSAILFGVTNLQCYIYYHRYPNDWSVHKYSVALLWILDTLHLALTIHAAYYYLVQNFGSIIAMEYVVWSLKLQISVNVTIILLVQSLYTNRVWKLGAHSNMIFPIVVSLIVAGGFAIGILLAVQSFRVTTFAALSFMSWSIYSSFAASTGIDFVIAGAMTFYLTRNRMSEFSGTNSTVSTLIRYILSSGLATSACSMAALLTFALMPNNMVFLSIEFILSKLYVNSFLAMLNARQSLRERNEVGYPISFDLTRTSTFPESPLPVFATVDGSVTLSTQRSRHDLSDAEMGFRGGRRLASKGEIEEKIIPRDDPCELTPQTLAYESCP